MDAETRLRPDFALLGPSQPDGVYFGMPHDDYLKVGAGSSSLYRSALISPLTAWTYHINPDRVDEPTDAQDEGTTLHKRLLEGESAFREHFAGRPENDGTWADTLEDLKGLCRVIGAPVTGSKDALCARIHEKHPNAKLWPVYLKDFHAANEGKIILKADAWRRLELRARLVLMHPEVKHFFTLGCPEVSVFWHDENGMPQKCRLDWLTSSWALDLKYFANVMDKPVEIAVNKLIPQYRIQARHYLDGVERAKEFAREGRVFGTMPDSEFIKAFMDTPEHRFAWLFVQKGDVPEVEPVEFCRSENGGSDNDYWTDAGIKIDRAKNIVRQCLLTFGSDPWFIPRKMRKLTDQATPYWSIDAYDPIEA